MAWRIHYTSTWKKTKVLAKTGMNKDLRQLRKNVKSELKYSTGDAIKYKGSIHREKLLGQDGYYYRIMRNLIFK